MNEITSTSNKRIIELTRLHKRKYLEESEFFLVEGIKSLEELVESDINIVEIFVTEQNRAKLSNIEKYQVTIVSEHVLKKLSTTESAPEVVVLAKKKKYKYSDLSNKNLLILLENIKDAGNLGTIIRSAVAFNCGGILLYGDTVEIYNSKVIRSSTGNFFKIPILKLNNINDLKTYFNGYKLLATSLSNKNNIGINTINTDEKNVIMLGSEATGVTNELINQADFNIKINHSKNVESLNLSVAASILLYEIYKNN